MIWCWCAPHQSRELIYYKTRKKGQRTLEWNDGRGDARFFIDFFLFSSLLRLVSLILVVGFFLGDCLFFSSFEKFAESRALSWCLDGGEGARFAEKKGKMTLFASAWFWELKRTMKSIAKLLHPPPYRLRWVTQTKKGETCLLLHFQFTLIITFRDPLSRQHNPVMRGKLKMKRRKKERKKIIQFSIFAYFICT